MYVISREGAQDDPGVQANLSLASQYGVKIHTVESDDIAVGIAEFARQAGITNLFIGQSASVRPHARSIPEQIAAYLPETDIHIIPDRSASSYPQTYGRISSFSWHLRDLLVLVMVMAAATLVSVLIDRSSFSNSNIVTIYILAVLIVSVMTSHRYYGIGASILYILLFNYLFIEPRFTFLVYDPGYLVTYLVSITAALITGSLASRMKNTARRSAENAYQAGILLDTSNQLETVRTSQEKIRVTLSQLTQLLKRPVYYYPDDMVPEDLTETERKLLQEVRENRFHEAGYTKAMAQSRFRFLRILSGEHAYGCLGIEMQGRAFSEFENMILLSIVNETALALENERIKGERKEAEVNAEKEHFKAGLLRSISHDLRTPLTSIYGNVNNLAESADQLSDEDKQKIYEDLKNDSFWLREQMENILMLTRLESDPVLHLSAESVDDVIAEALRHLDPHASEHIIETDTEENLFADMEAGLIVTVLVNLINNAVKYTPTGSRICISAKRTDSLITVSVADDGNGISDEDKAHIFELYYTGRHTLTDRTRSMGVGLNLCKTILQAHGQTIGVSDNLPHGAVFSFTLKAEDIIHE
ncbi:MAG: DUF4118 domain-containing protein [Solobacterium sp.]|nr:DUF4118 domain-containing protein [Solobacterium sp.]